jgi:hypothetical protein
MNYLSMSEHPFSSNTLHILLSENGPQANDPHFKSITDSVQFHYIDNNLSIIEAAMTNKFNLTTQFPYE